MPVAAQEIGVGYMIAYTTEDNFYMGRFDGISFHNIADLSHFDPQQPQWSPDGSYLAFYSVSCGSEAWSLCLVNSEGAKLESLVNGLRVPNTLNWSPDGQFLAYVARDETYDNDNMYIINRDVSGLRKITSCEDCRISHVTWSPNGEQIAFIIVRFSSNMSKLENLYTINSNGSELRQLTDCNDCSLHKNITWSPDSNQIAFNMYDRGSKLYSVDADGSNLQVLSSNYGSSLSIFWLTDSSYVGLRTQKGICPVCPDQCCLCDVVQEWYGNYPSISPDRFRILFEKYGQIYMMNLEDGSEVQLTFDENPAFELGDSVGPAWSPDGNYIAFLSTREGNWALYIMNADGSNVQQIANRVGWFSWQPVNLSTFDWY